MLTGSQRVIQIICTNSINCSGFVYMESRNREKYLVWNPLCSNAKLHSYKDYKYEYALKTNRWQVQNTAESFSKEKIKW